MEKIPSQTKKFCLAGPIDPQRHYFIPKRLDWQLLNTLIENREYFVLHAPRQSGKKTAVREFMAHINAEGRYYALFINVESAQAARDNIIQALIAIVELLRIKIERTFPDHTQLIGELRCMIKEQPITLDLLFTALTRWAELTAKRVILFVDEIDSLIGDSLLSVLRQIRAGFNERPDHFPQSLCLVGLRDVRDYKVWSREHGVYVSSSSPFNIKAESLSLSNFSLEDVHNLYHQHTQATGQKFTQEAVSYAFFLTQGQPWLVNALAYQACFRDVIDRTVPITKESIERAKQSMPSNSYVFCGSTKRSCPLQCFIKHSPM